MATAQALFTDMRLGKNGAPRPELITYSIMIGAYAHLARVDEALDLLWEMDELRGMRPNARIWAAAVMACEAASQPRKAMQLLDAADGACKMADERLKLWQMIVAYRVKKGRAGDAMEALGTMLNRGIISEKVYYESALLMCRDGGWHELAMQLLRDALNRRISLDLRCYTAALEACVKGMAWQSALTIIFNMQARAKASSSSSRGAVVPDRKCFTAAIVVCGHAGRWWEAERLMGEMTAAGVSQDVVSYNALMNAFAKAGKWERALETLETMEKSGLRPDLISFNTALDGCATAGQGQACLDLMKEMKTRGIMPDDISYTNAIAGC